LIRGKQFSLADDQDVAWLAVDPVEKLEHRIDFGE
jgi:hypothetical protein